MSLVSSFFLPRRPEHFGFRPGLFAVRRTRLGAERLSHIIVRSRSDGAIAIEGASSRNTRSNCGTPVILKFFSPDCVEPVLAAVRLRFAKRPVDESGEWYLDMPRGEIAAALKAEAKARRFSFEIIHPDLRDAPIIRSGRRGRTRRAVGAAFYTLLTAAALTGLIAAAAFFGR